MACITFISACNVLTLHTWGESNNSPLTGLHAMWALGFTLGPLVMRPFFAKQTNTSIFLSSFVNSNVSLDQNNQTEHWMNNTKSQTSSILTTQQLNGTTDILVEGRSEIEVAFVIVAIIALFVAMFIFASYMLGSPNGYKPTYTRKGNIKDLFKEQCCGGNQYFTVFIMTFFCFFYFFNTGRENTFSTWLFNYAVKSDLQLSKQEAALLDFSAKFSFLMGRVLATLIAIKIHVKVMLFCEVRILFVQPFY